VVACSIYASCTETDFTTSYGIIIVISVAMFVLFIVTLFTSSPFIYNLYCCLGVILFGIYLIIDTQMIMGGRSVELAVDQFYLAAMLLYIDIIQIFLYILQLLSNKD
jgi:protein lifeguard